MTFLEFKENLKNYIVFSTQDIKKNDVNFDSRRLTEWQKKEYIKKIRRGYYVFSDTKIDEKILFLIANKIYFPSYVSLETALSYYNLIPEAVYNITCVSSKKTFSLKTEWGNFSYQRVKPSLMFGYEIINFEEHSFKIANIEKTLLDYFYLNPQIKTQQDFYELRINQQELKNQLDKIKLTKYLKVFNNQQLAIRINNFLKFIDYA